MFPMEISEADFYVATDGSDAWSGTLAEPNAEETDGPFATLQRARDAVRELKREKKGPITILVRGGTYYLQETLVFGPQDSGTKDQPITYAAYPGEIPVISGGRRIVGEWKPYRDGIMMCELPEVKAGKLNFRQLFVNGKRRTRSRIPGEGYYIAEEVVDATAFKYKAGDFQRWHNLSDIEVIVFHAWNESRLLISELDEEKRTVRFADPEAKHPIGWADHTRYYIENVFEGLECPGQWYLDTHAGVLYYWPVDDIENSEVIVPVLDQLVRFEGDIKEQHIQYISICGLTFSDTSWTLPEKGYPDCGDVGDIVEPSAITLGNVRYCTLRDNCIRNVGTYALELTGYGNQIIGNEICSTGSGGMIIRNYDEEHNVFSYNHIHHCGEVYPSAVGINIDDGGGTISHNLIHDTSHSGIYARHFSTEDQPMERENQEQCLIIEYNEIYNVMGKINDGGGIFVRDSNIIIRNNVIHDSFSCSVGAGSASWGVYLGCDTRNTRVENNVVYRTRAGQLVWHGNKNNTIENNIFVNGESVQINYTNPGHLHHENVKLVRNIIYSTEADAILFHVAGERSLPAESDYNVIFHAGGKELVNRGVPEISSFKKWQERGFDTHSVVADPLFVDPANDDYSLKPDSPAFKLGFKPIDVSKVGLKGKKPE